MADLSTELCGLKLPTPILAAAGPGTATGEAMIEAAAGGAGGIVSVTIAPRAPATHDGAAAAPVKVDRTSLLNEARWTGLSLERWLDEEFPHALVAAGKYRVPLIASVGYAPREVREVVPAIERTGVDAFELSCQFLDPGEVIEAARALRESTRRPVIVKLSPNVADIGDLAAALEPLADAIACINAVGPGLKIDVETGRAALGSPSGFGWLTGAAIKPIALRAVYEVARRVRKPVIAGGGVASGRDAAEFLLAGATAVEVCTAAILHGPQVYGKIARELSDWLDARGYPSAAAARGAYLRKWGGGQRVVTEKEEAPAVDAAACIGCTICERVCFYDAIDAPPRVVATVHAEPCFQCGLCVSACPVDALSFAPREKVTLAHDG